MNGIHHVTAIAGHPQENVNFYAGTLGLRLVKRTVNFDDPLTYHLYYGTEIGAPGTILTFFAWPDARRGRPGAGQVNATALAVPPGSLPWWQERFRERGVAQDLPLRRFQEEVLPFRDPDGLPLELVAPAVLDPRPAWRAGPVPEPYAIRGVHAIAAHEEGYERTAHLLLETLRFREVAREGNRFRYACEEGAGYFDLLCTPDAPPARSGAGTVHHVAWSVPNDVEQAAWRQTLVSAELNVSPVMDRQYFHSIYFREPGGVLLEIATDAPGFTVDEPSDALGAALRLPPWLERSRAQIEAGLAPLTSPT